MVIVLVLLVAMAMETCSVSWDFWVSEGDEDEEVLNEFCSCEEREGGECDAE